MAGVDWGMVGNRWDPGRIEAFSDGVFAFAITLLVLDIAVPESEFNHLWRAIADQWPSYLGYATSFLTVGGIWMVHHAVFRRVQYANRRVMTVNLVLLMAVAFLPFPTKLVAEAIRDSSAERSAVIFYGAWLLVISQIFSALWASVASDRGLLKPGVSEKEVNAIARVTTPNLGFLRRRDRARVHRPKGGRVRLPGNCDRRHPASARRQRADTNDTAGRVNTEAAGCVNTAHATPGSRVLPTREASLRACLSGTGDVSVWMSNALGVRAIGGFRQINPFGRCALGRRAVGSC